MVAAIKARYPEEEVEVWSEDEARIGLQPIIRRVWAKRGERPLAVVEPRYEWLWLYAAINPATGHQFWLIMPQLNSRCVQLFLSEFAAAECREGKRIVLLWDGAGAHRGQDLKVDDRITLFRIPAYTPELNPTERVWDLAREAVVNERVKDLDELEERLCERCRKISEEEVKALTNYHWLPK